MILTKAFAPTDILSIKLVNGDEIVAELVEETNTTYLVARATVVLPSSQGGELMQAMQSVDIKQQIPISKHAVMMIAETVPELIQHYVKLTTGKETPRKQSTIV